MGRGTGVKGFLIFVLSLAIIFVLCLIFSTSDKCQVEDKEEIIEEEQQIIEEEQQIIDLENFEMDDDGGFYVIEAMIVPKEWRSDI